MNSNKNFKRNVIYIFLLLCAARFSEAGVLDVEYLVPEGFSASEIDTSMQLLVTFHNKSLPAPVYWSAKDGKLIFDEQALLINGINKEQIDFLKKILDKIPYMSCSQGCDYKISNQLVILDKIKQSLIIIDGKDSFVHPETSFGLVHNQFVDVRTATNGYRSTSIAGQGYLGLPSQSYGFLGWYRNDNSSKNYQSSEQGISTWYLQKNFSNTYLRSGRQDAKDYAAGTVRTSLNPSFDHFITLGSQDNLKRNTNSAGKLILFAISDGDYEFYRDGRLILRLPAAIGRNEIDYNQLPGGFYSVEIKLVNRSGQLISSEVQQLANINYGEAHGWYLTLGEMDNYVSKEVSSNKKKLINTGANFSTDYFAISNAILKSTGKEWALETNITRPTQFSNIELSPTLGITSGEKKTGTFANMYLGNISLGFVSASIYQNSNVSDLTPGANSSSFSYSRSLSSARLSYNYSRYAKKDRHQVQTTWNWFGHGVQAIISTGIQKDSYSNEKNNYGLFLNTTFILNNSSGTLNASYSNGHLNTGGSYTREFEDTLGTTTAGLDFNDIGQSNSVGLSAHRSGTRGDTSVGLGVDDKIASGRFAYRGMFAASKDGAAFGRSSSSGAALLVETPSMNGITDGFKVEGNPVGGGGSYLVPIMAYHDISYAKAESIDSKVDINISLPANIVRAHPGQVYSVKADIVLSLVYSGFMIDKYGNRLGGTLEDSGEIVYPNGLFSLTSSKLLKYVTLKTPKHVYYCDLTRKVDNFYTCEIR